MKEKRNMEMKRYTEIIFYIVTLVLILSGFLIHPMGEILAVKVIHKLSGVLFCLFLLGHATRYKAFRKVMKNVP